MENICILKCYVCNESVKKSTATSLLSANLPFTKVTIAQTIGRLIGNQYMVLVSEKDFLCKKCTQMFNELDRLETHVVKIKTEIIMFLKIKYALDNGQISPISPQSSSDRKQNKDAVKQLSKMFDNPTTVPKSNENTERGVKRKHESNLKCPLCREDFSDINFLRKHITDNHISKYKCTRCTNTFQSEEELEKHSPTCQQAENLKKFKCALCLQKFETKENLNVHLKKHKTAYFKCGSCGETFRKRDLLMKHLEIHTNKLPPVITADTTPASENCKQNDASENTTKLGSGKEIKFIDCNTCALSYIDNEHYFSHLNSAHRQTKSGENQTIDSSTLAKEDSEHLDLETIFERLHSDNNETGIETNEAPIDITNPIADGEDVLELLSEDFHTQTNSTIVKEKKTHSDQSYINDKVYLYKCPGCSTLYDNSTDLQSHIFTTGHADLTSDIQIIEVQNVDNIKYDSSELSTFLPLSVKQTEDQQSFDQGNEIKLMSMEEAVQNTSNIQFITSTDNGGEIKFITFENSDDVGFNGQTDIYDLNSNDMTELSNQASSDKNIQDLFDGVIDEPPVKAAVNTNMAERSKIQILDEKTIDISQLINMNKSGQFFYINTLDLNVKPDNPQINEIDNNALSQLISLPIPTEDSSELDLNKSPLINTNVDLKEAVPSPNRKIYKCCRCDFKCLQHETIKMHMSKHANDAKSNVGTNKNDNNATLLNCNDCKVCNKSFKSLTLLNRHNNTFHREPICVFCNKQMRNIQLLRAHEQRHVQAGDECTCADCGKQYKTRSGLNNHQAVHTGNYKLFCEFCNRGFLSKVVLEEHRRKHTKEEKFVCDICGKKFQFKSTYWIHKKWHDNPFPYKCNYCNRKFRHTSLLAVHKRKHTGERPYKCSHCKQTFSVSGTLKTHLLLHTGAYPHKCDVCQKGFPSKYKYAVHMSKVHDTPNLLNTVKQSDFKIIVREPDDDKIVADDDGLWTNRRILNDDDDSNINEIIKSNPVLIEEPDSDNICVAESVDCAAVNTNLILNNWLNV